MVHGRNRDSEYSTDRIPALNTTPKDVAGAGDSVFTAASMALLLRRRHLACLVFRKHCGRASNRPRRQQADQPETKSCPKLARLITLRGPLCVHFSLPRAWERDCGP